MIVEKKANCKKPFYSLESKYCLVLCLILSLTCNGQIYNTCFSPTVNNTYSVSTGPGHLVAADFNNDGFKDIVTANWNNFSEISLLLGTGTGSFLPAFNYTSTPYLSDLANSDFNSDGNMDLVVTSQFSDIVSVLMGNGSGGFSSVTDYTVPRPTSVITGDFNNDAYPDILVGNSYSLSFTQLTGSSTGSFNATATYTIGYIPICLAKGHFNSDTYFDVAVLDIANNLRIYTGTSSGTLSSAVSYSLQISTSKIVCLDFNSDLKTDIAYNNYNNELVILNGSGNATFSLANTFSNVGLPNGLCTGDFNADGNIDFGTSASSGAINIVYGTGSSSISPVYNYSASAIPYYVISADFNNDGKADLAASNYISESVTVFMSATGPSVSIANSSSISCAGSSITLSSTGAYTYSWSTSSTSANIVVTPSTNTTYTVTGYDNVGCRNISIITVSVLTAPVISSNGGSICVGSSFTITPSGAATYTISSGSTIVTPSTTSTYTIWGTDVNGCTGNTQTPVFVNPLPTITINSGSLCSGKSFTLSPSGASTYTYSSGTSIVTPSSNATYSVIGMSSQGCISSNTALSTLTVYSTPTIIVSSGSICAGSDYTISPSGGTTYTYSTGSAIFSPTSTVTFTVTGMNVNSCTATATSSIFVQTLPFITAISGSICTGQQFTFNPTGASTYTYSGGSSVVSPSTNTSYTITGTDQYGCHSSNSVTALITVNPLPTVTVNSASICPNQSYTLTPSGATSYNYSSGSNIVNPSVTTTYSINGINSMGCLSANPATATVLVIPLPTVSVNSGQICIGDVFTLTPSGAGNYTISAGTNTVSPLSSTDYFVIGANSIGCLSSNTAIASITVNALPHINLFSSDTLICVGENVNISALGASTYTWNNGSNMTLINVIPLTNTTYSLIGTDSLGCENSASIVQMVDACTGIRSVQTSGLDNKIELYPNPNSGQFYIKLDVTSPIVISNMMGEVVFKKLLSEGVNSINLEECSNGIYFINFGNTIKQQVIKVIKH